jgi:outer membrane lipoprotein-sorting protein
MSMNHDPLPDFEHRLGQLHADDAARPEHQAALREQALAAFDRAARGHNTRSWKRLVLFGRDIMKRPLPRYLSAAAVLAVLAWLFWPGANQPAFALSRMVDAVVSARSARFQMEIKVEGQLPQSARTMFQAPALYRMEMTPLKDQKVINVSDFEAAKMLTLMPEQKQAVVFNLKNVPKGAANNDKLNHFENLRRLLSEQRDKLPAHERLGEKTIDGRKAEGFRLESGLGTLTLWGDPATGNPIRIENVYSGVPRTEVVMTQFEMNVELPRDLFSLEIPRDYKVQTFDIEASRPEERDLIDSLKTCASLSGGSFPDALDAQSVMKLMIDTVLNGKKEGKEPDMQQLMLQSIKIGRGFEFALNLPASAKAHYAGKGVKEGTADRPIFWYVPEGARRPRVIDATLRVREADEAPRVEGAVPLTRKGAGSESR